MSRLKQRVAELRKFDGIEIRNRPVRHDVARAVQQVIALTHRVPLRIVPVRRSYEQVDGMLAAHVHQCRHRALSDVVEPVVLQLTTDDVFIGFRVPELGVRADIVPGKTGELCLTPQTPGKFDFICDVFCGDKHEEMQGQIVVS